MKKASSVLLDLLIKELLRTQLIPRESVLKSSRALVQHGGYVNSVICADIYVRKVFDADVLPREHRLHSFLKTALDLCDRDELYQELAHQLLTRSSFVPRVITHESTVDISATSFQALSPATPGQLLNRARTRSEVMPFLRAIDVTLLRSFEISPGRSKPLTRCVALAK